MTRFSVIGGIYNRPIAIANFSHFTIAGLALIKGISSDPGLDHILWGAAIVYSVFALAYGVIVFRNPSQGSQY